MPFTRRDILKTAAAAGAAAALAGCEGALSEAGRRLGQSVPAALAPPAGDAVDPIHHLLSRAGYGPWPGDVERVRAMGADPWIEEQLAPEAIDDAACALRARRFETLQAEPGTCYE